MKSLSRRSFFSSIGSEAARAAVVAAGELGLSNVGGSGGELRPPEECPLGRVSDYPPGVVRSFQIGAIAVEARAVPEGVRARKKSEDSWNPVSIRMGEDGSLLAQLDVSCNELEVFSLFSGKMKLP